MRAKPARDPTPLVGRRPKADTSAGEQQQAARNLIDRQLHRASAEWEDAAELAGSCIEHAQRPCYRGTVPYRYLLGKGDEE